MNGSDGLLPAGTPAPDFTATTTDGRTVTLSEFRGRSAVLLMFYPKDDTPGCTRQMCTARDQRDPYDAAGVLRFGVNQGSIESHRRFSDKYSLDFPLIVDEGQRIAAAFGSVKESGGTARSTILVDRAGTIVFSEPGAHGAGEVLGAMNG